MTEELRPNSAETQFLNLAYNRFYDIFEEAMDDSFWSKTDWERFSKIKEVFAIMSVRFNF